jgi:hypothetical protein
MAVGMAISKTEIDARAGDITRGFQKAFGDVATLKSFLDQTADSDLVALGYSSEDVTLLKSAFGDLWQLGQIWSGQADLQVAKDFRVFVRALWGVGSF